MMKADHEKDQQEIGALENELAATTDDLEQVNKENTEVLYHILQIGFFYIKHSFLKNEQLTIEFFFDAAPRLLDLASLWR